MELTRLQWDSNFFGLNVYALKVPEHGCLNVDEVKQQLMHLNADVAYVFINENDKELNKRIEASGACLYDEKITYSLNIIPNDSFIEKSIVTYEGVMTPELTALAYQAGEYSRFKLDPGFKSHFEKFYAHWIANALDPLSGEKIFVCMRHDKVMGLIICSFKNDIGKLGLLAVDKIFRGLGIGKELMLAAENHFHRNGVSFSTLVTQKANIIACRLYEKRGYNVIKTEKVYHWWFKN